MKNSISALVLMTVILFSCEKEETTATVQIKDTTATVQIEDQGCIEWKKVLVTDHSGYTINSSNIPIITGLFTNNNIDKSNYRYYYYSDDSLQTQFPPYAKVDRKIIRIKEFRNGLEIFTGEIVFLFTNNILYFQNGKPSGGTSLNTTPNQTVRQIRTLFLGTIEQFDHEGNRYKDSCFSAEFGYYNLNAGVSSMPENLIKAWKITLKNKIYPSEIPIAYYQDNDGKLIYYDNGIIH